MTTLLAVVVALAGGATASAYPPDPAVLTVSNRNLAPSTSFVASVSGYTPGESVTFYLVGNDPVTVTCGPDGVATITLISPSTPGRYDVTAVRADGTVLTVSITVTAAGSIPRTGSDATSSALLLGLGLVVFGGAFLGVARFRRRGRSTALA